MGYQIRLDVESLERAVSALKVESAKLVRSRRNHQLSSLASFSPVSGFKQMGRKLETVSNFYSPESFSALADHVMDAAKITETNVANAQRADGSFASTFDSLHVPNVDFHGIMGQFLANMESVNAKASPFIPQEPVVLPQRSLPLLHNQFMATNAAAPHAESMYWNGVATQITDSVTSLYGVKNLLGLSLIHI